MYYFLSFLAGSSSKILDDLIDQNIADHGDLSIEISKIIFAITITLILTGSNNVYIYFIILSGLLASIFDNNYWDDQFWISSIYIFVPISAFYLLYNFNKISFKNLILVILLSSVTFWAILVQTRFNGPLAYIYKMFGNEEGIIVKDEEIGYRKLVLRSLNCVTCLLQILIINRVIIDSKDALDAINMFTLFILGYCLASVANQVYHLSRPPR